MEAADGRTMTLPPRTPVAVAAASASPTSASCLLQWFAEGSMTLSAYFKVIKAAFFYASLFNVGMLIWRGF